MEENVSLIKEQEPYLRGLVEGAVDCGDSDFMTVDAELREDCGELVVGLDLVGDSECGKELNEIVDRINAVIRGYNMPLIAYARIELVIAQDE